MVEPNPALLVDDSLGPVDHVFEQSEFVRGDGFMDAAANHDVVNTADVDRHLRNKDARLRDDGFGRRNQRLAVIFCVQTRVHFDGVALQVFFRLTEGPAAINVRRRFSADVGISDGLEALRQDAGFIQSIHPCVPVRSAHNEHGIADFFRGRDADGQLADIQIDDVDGRSSNFFADRFDR